MTRDEFWTALDAVCASPDRSQSLLEMTSLLRDAYQQDLPVLIACTRTPGRIHHAYTHFYEGNPDLLGNRYLICFTSPEQATHRVNAPAAVEDLSLEERFRLIDESTSSPDLEEQTASLSLEERFRLIDEGEDEQPKKKARRRRKKAATTGMMWKANAAAETATVGARAILDYMRRNRLVGGLVFNVYDEKHSIALPKFMMA